MLRRNITFRLIITAGIVCTVFCVAQYVHALTAEEVSAKVYNSETQQTMHSLVKMDLVDKDGTVSTRYVEQWSYKYEGELEKNVIVFHAPASIKGTRFLQVEYNDRDDDQWIYLPALKKVRRIAAQEGGKSFMGTDFSYDDMKRRRVEKYHHEIVREEQLDGYDCYVLKLWAKDPSDSDYAYLLRWVPKDIWVPIKVELYNKNDELDKIGVSKNLKKVQGHWTAIYSEMKNVKNGHRTTLEFKKLAYDEEIDEGLFTTQFLKTGRP